MDYKEPKALNDVAKFHNAFNLPILEEPTIPAADRCELRVNLLQEELDELKDAIKDGDLVEIADALSDLQYVLSGAVLEFGLADRFEALFSEVQRSNMSKICPTMEDAQKTQQHYKETNDTESYIEERDGQYFVYRTGDNKVLKSVSYSPADLKTIVKR